MNLIKYLLCSKDKNVLNAIQIDKDKIEAELKIYNTMLYSDYHNLVNPMPDYFFGGSMMKFQINPNNQSFYNEVLECRNRLIDQLKTLRGY